MPTDSNGFEIASEPKSLTHDSNGFEIAATQVGGLSDSNGFVLANQPSESEHDKSHDEDGFFKRTWDWLNSEIFSSEGTKGGKWLRTPAENYGQSFGKPAANLLNTMGNTPLGLTTTALMPIKALEIPANLMGGALGIGMVSEGAKRALNAQTGPEKLQGAVEAGLGLFGLKALRGARVRQKAAKAAIDTAQKHEALANNIPAEVPGWSIGQDGIPRNVTEQNPMPGRPAGSFVQEEPVAPPEARPVTTPVGEGRQPGSAVADVGEYTPQPTDPAILAEHRARRPVPVPELEPPPPQEVPPISGRSEFAQPSPEVEVAASRDVEAAAMPYRVGGRRSGTFRQEYPEPPQAEKTVETGSGASPASVAKQSSIRNYGEGHFLSHPIVQELVGAGGIVSKSAAKKSGKWQFKAQEYDDAPIFKNPTHNKIYNERGLTPDQAAQVLVDKGMLPEGSTAHDMWKTIDGISNGSRGELENPDVAIGKEIDKVQASIAPTPKGKTVPISSAAEMKGPGGEKLTIEVDPESDGTRVKVKNKVEFTMNADERVKASAVTKKAEKPQFNPKTGQMDAFGYDQTGFALERQKEKGGFAEAEAKQNSDEASKAQDAAQSKMSLLGRNPEAGGIITPTQAEMDAFAARIGKLAQDLTAKDMAMLRLSLMAASARSPVDKWKDLVQQVNSSRELRETPLGRFAADTINSLDIHAYDLASAFKTKAAREKITSLADGGDAIGSAAGMAAKTHYNTLVGEGIRKAGQEGKAKKIAEDEINVRSRALSLAASGMLPKDGFQMWARANWDKPGTDRAAYLYALSHWGEMERMRADHATVTDALLAAGEAAGLNLSRKEGYVPQAWELRAGRSGKTSFTRGSEYGNYHEGINAGDIPANLDIRDLMSDRTARQVKKIERMKWADAMRSMDSPFTGEPIVADMVEHPVSGKMEPPKGYVSLPIVAGHPIAVEKSFANTINSIIGTSHVPKSLMNSFGFVKHGMVGFDTYHMVRLASIEMAYGKTAGYKNGLTVLNFLDGDLNEGVRQGLITQKQAEFALRSRHDVNQMLSRGLQATRTADAIYRDFINATPIIKDTAGAFTRFLFDKIQRGATIQVALKNLERIRDLHPEWTPDKQYSQAVADSNIQFRSFGKQGWFRNSTWQDASRLLLFAPQWFEGLVKGTVAGYKDIGELAVNTVKGKPIVRGAETGKMRLNMGNNGTGAVVGTAALMAAGQALNYATTGHLTYDNPEGHKTDVFIPSMNGGPGYWFNPTSFFMELTHDIAKYSQRAKDPNEVAVRIINNKLQPVARGIKESFITNTDFYGRPVTRARWWPYRMHDKAVHFLRSINPTPLAIQAGIPTGEANDRHDSQQQIQQSLGFKTTKDRSGYAPTPIWRGAGIPPSPMSPLNVPMIPLPTR